MDRITVDGLSVETRIGVTDKERSRPQDVSIDIDIAKDLAQAGSSDSIDDTVDYDALVADVAALVRGSECNLLERLASKIADQVAAKPGVVGVTVRVSKQHVPVNEEVGSISVYVGRGSLA